jgi:hypothetical protein
MNVSEGPSISTLTPDMRAEIKQILRTSSPGLTHDEVFRYMEQVLGLEGHRDRPVQRCVATDRGSERNESSCGLRSGSQVADPTVENFGVSDPVKIVTAMAFIVIHLARRTWRAPA